MRKTNLFFLSLMLAASMILLVEAQYGEEATSLGQFVDEFTDLNNVSVNVNVVRNSTFDAMELNKSTGSFLYRDFENMYEINLDPNPLDANVTQLPVLLYLNSSAGQGKDDLTDIFDIVGNSFQKIAITNDAQDVEYYVEIEYWDAVTEVAEIWTSVNHTNLANTTIKFFYDGDAANNTAFVGYSGTVNASKVWDNNFLTVLHLNEASGDFLDSTLKYNATSQGDSVVRGRYLIDGGVDLGGTNDFLEIDTAGIDGGLDDLTIEAWVNADAYGGVDRAVMGDWGGAAQTFLLYYDNAPNNKWRALFRDSGVGARDVFFGDTPPTAGTLYYLVGSYERNDKIRGYQNGALTNGDAVPNLATDTTASKIAIGEEVSGGDKDFSGKIDEVRLSDVRRSTAYINATYYMGLDDFVDWVNQTSVSTGYDLEGYFTTTDYLDNVNGSTLALMTISRIFPNTHITVQVSDDNATWGDAEGIPGDSHDLSGGLETIDLRPWNESGSVYVMCNLSTSDSSITPYLNQSRLITTEGVVAPPIIGANVTGIWTYFDASEIGVTTGTHDSGGLVNVSLVDGTYFNVSEVVGVPGMDISFNFTGIPSDAECMWLVINSYYDGNLAHVFDIDLWNFTGASWETIGHIPDQTGFEWVNSSIYDLRIPNDYVNGGVVRGRLYHLSAGNINHDLSIEFLNIHAEIPSTVTPSVTPSEFDYSWIAIAIILMCVAYLLASRTR